MDKIDTPDTLLDGDALFYQPDQYFHGLDQFTFYAVDRSPSPHVLANISVEAVPQYPVLKNELYELSISLRKSTYSIDLQEIVFDPDEDLYFDLQIVQGPKHGRWFIVEPGQAPLPVDWSLASVRLGVSPPQILELHLDNEPATQPYFEMVLSVADSTGLPAREKLALTGTVKCEPETVVNVWMNGPICVPCPKGAECSLTGLSNITNAFGYYPVVRENELLFIACVPPEACARASFQNGQMICGRGYTGTRCGSCASRYYAYGQQCVPCPRIDLQPWQVWSLALLAALVLLYLAYWLSKLDMAFLGILSTYLQAVSAFHGLNLNWPPLVKTFLGYLAVFNLNINVISPECFQLTESSKTFEFKFYFTLLLPIALLVCVALLYFGVECFKFFQRLGHWNEPRSSLISRIASNAQDVHPFPKPRKTEAFDQPASKFSEIEPIKSENGTDSKTLKSDFKTGDQKVKTDLNGKETTIVLYTPNRSLLGKLLAAYLTFMKFMFMMLASTSLSLWNCRWDEKSKHYFFLLSRKVN